MCRRAEPPIGEEEVKKIGKGEKTANVPSRHRKEMFHKVGHDGPATPETTQTTLDAVQNIRRVSTPASSPVFVNEIASHCHHPVVKNHLQVFWSMFRSGKGFILTQIHAYRWAQWASHALPLPNVSAHLTMDTTEACDIANQATIYVSDLSLISFL